MMPRSKLIGALTLDSKRIDVLNNLAYLLAIRKEKLPEARSLIDRAIDQAGPQGPLLDTRVVAKLASGQAADALADAYDAASEAHTAVPLFHLTQAYLLTGNRDAARKSMEDAITRGLNLKNVHPLEASSLQEMESQLQLLPR